MEGVHVNREMGSALRLSVHGAEPGGWGGQAGAARVAVRPRHHQRQGWRPRMRFLTVSFLAGKMLRSEKRFLKQVSSCVPQRRPGVASGQLRVQY